MLDESRLVKSIGTVVLELKWKSFYGLFCGGFCVLGLPVHTRALLPVSGRNLRSN